MSWSFFRSRILFSCKFCCIFCWESKFPEWIATPNFASIRNPRAPKKCKSSSILLFFIEFSTENLFAYDGHRWRQARHGSDLLLLFLLAWYDLKSIQFTVNKYLYNYNCSKSQHNVITELRCDIKTLLIYKLLVVNPQT